MPYLDASRVDLQRSHGLADADLPDAAILFGVWSTGGKLEQLRARQPDSREVMERTALVVVDGQRVWVIFVFGGAMAATHAHLAAVMGARAILQIGTYGGLASGASVGDVLLPSQVIGRDGVSRQLSRNRPIIPDRALRKSLVQELHAGGIGPKDGTLVSTTTIALERQRDIRRWARAGYAGVEMEAAATLSTAQHFGVPAAAGLVLIDNVGSEHTVFHLTPDERQRMHEARDTLVWAALVTAAHASSNGAADR